MFSLKEILHTIVLPQKRRLLFKLLLIYLLVALPFQVLVILSGFTNIRPVIALCPIFVFFFGPTGAWATGLGNLAYDIIANSLAWSSIAGFIANFSSPLVMYMLWHRIAKTPFSIHNLHTLGIYTIVIIVGALLNVIIIAPSIMFFYPEVPILNFVSPVLYNNIIFPLVPGVAIIIFMQNYYGLKDYREI